MSQLEVGSFLNRSGQVPFQKKKIQMHSEWLSFYLSLYTSPAKQWLYADMFSSESGEDGFYHGLAQDSSAEATATQIMLVPAE